MNVQINAEQDEPPKENSKQCGKYQFQQVNRNVVLFPGNNQSDDNVDQPKEADTSATPEHMPLQIPPQD
jgi:hypothetical protein